MNDPDTDFVTRRLSNDPARPSPNFDEDVLCRVRRHRRAGKIRRVSMNGILVFLLGLTAWENGWLRDMGIVGKSRQRESALKGVEWLLAAQHGDGRWDAAEWGGHVNYSQGVSALATLALLHAPEPVDRARIEAAAEYLQSRLREQRTGGALSGSEYYNHLLALNTLISLRVHAPDRERERLVDDALRDLIRRQQPDGGWGYEEEQPFGYERAHRPSSNSAVTWWVCHLLDKHRGRPLPGGARALAAGRNWLRDRLDSPHAIAYQVDGPSARADDALFWMAARDISALETTDLPAITTPDAYRDVFRTRALHRALALDEIYAGQMDDGAWNRPGDRWWKAGGRIYVTASSILSLVPQGGV